jgi:hypothetical protein
MLIYLIIFVTASDIPRVGELMLAMFPLEEITACNTWYFSTYSPLSSHSPTLSLYFFGVDSY